MHQTEILELVKNGPVPVRSLKNRRAAFRLAYAQLLREGKIVEHGSGAKMDPKYVGLPGADFPERRVAVNPADVVLLMLAGVPEDEARATLTTACSAGGDDEVMRVIEPAYKALVREGYHPYNEVPKALQRKWRGKPVEPLEGCGM